MNDFGTFISLLIIGAALVFLYYMLPDVVGFSLPAFL
jgi:hypothetical protein